MAGKNKEYRAALIVTQADGKIWEFALFNLTSCKAMVQVNAVFITLGIRANLLFVVPRSDGTAIYLAKPLTYHQGPEN
jgi:hypothetical protein